MHRRSFPYAFVALCFVHCLFVAAAEKEKTESFATEIWKALRPDEKPAETDALSPLADLISSKNPEEMHDAISKLARALSTIDRDKFWKDLAEGIHVGDEYGAVPPKGWKYGSPGERILLARSLWTKAIDNKLPPDQARETGRAAILLAAGEGCMLARGEVAHMLADVERKKLSILNDAEMSRIKKIVATSKQQVIQYAKAHTKARTSVYDLIDEQFPIPPDRMKTVLQDISAVRAAAPDQFARYRVVDFTWALLNLLRQKEDVNSVALVTAYIKDWKEKVENPAVARWLDEAIKTNGPAPRRN